MNKAISNDRITIRLTWLFLITGLLFFGTAGTLKWLQAWLFFFLSSSSFVFLLVWMKKNDPLLLKDRMGFDKKKPRGPDKILLIFYTIINFILIALPGFDAVRFNWSNPPVFINIAGFLLALCSIYVLFMVIKENPYLSSIVEVYRDREHKTISSGIYRYIRHPWYVGLIIWFYSIPLALGSLFTLIPATLLSILLIIRIHMEEKALRKDLPGYIEYCNAVKYRLIPFIW